MKRKKFYQLDGVERHGNLIVDLVNHCNVGIYGPKIYFICWFFSGRSERTHKTEVIGQSVNNFYLNR